MSCARSQRSSAASKYRRRHKIKIQTAFDGCPLTAWWSNTWDVVFSLIVVSQRALFWQSSLKYICLCWWEYESCGEFSHFLEFNNINWLPSACWDRPLHVTVDGKSHDHLRLPHIGKKVTWQPSELWNYADVLIIKLPYHIWLQLWASYYKHIISVCG